MGKVLVTGASGFIGNYVVPELLKNGHQVIASSFSEKKARQFSWFSSVQYIPFNLAALDDTINYFQYFGTPDALIHLAWEGLPNYSEAYHVEVNLLQHLHFLTNLVKNGLTNLTVTGTCFEYGMREGKLDESMQPAPANAYAIAKDSLRKSLEQLQQDIPFNFKWVRLFYMYGPGQHPKSLFSQLEKALDEKAAVFNMSGGEQVRDYLAVEQVAALIVKTAMQNRVSGIINCCSGRPVTVKQWVEDYLQRTHQSIQLNTGYYPYSTYEPMAFWGDTKKLDSVL